jgi:hypothetical protein
MDAQDVRGRLEALAESNSGCADDARSRGRHHRRALTRRGALSSSKALVSGLGSIAALIRALTVRSHPRGLLGQIRGSGWPTVTARLPASAAHGRWLATRRAHPAQSAQRPCSGRGQWRRRSRPPCAPAHCGATTSSGVDLGLPSVTPFSFLTCSASRVRILIC